MATIPSSSKDSRAQEVGTVRSSYVSAKADDEAIGVGEERWRTASTLTGSLEKYEYAILSIALVLLTACSLALAWLTPFSIDEYLTRITDLAGSAGAIWQMQVTAPLSVDPPLYHFVDTYFLRILGGSEFASRILPALSYTAFGFLLYFFVRRYADMYTALTALMLTMLCGAFGYAYEARQYTWILAAQCLALVCWTQFAEGSSRKNWALFGLFVSVTVAVGSHWLGFMVLIPLGLGEIVRNWQERRIDVRVWGTLVCAGATAVLYLPLLRGASAYRVLPWKGVALSDIPESYSLVLQPCLFPLAVLLIVLGFATVMVRGSSRRLPVVRIPASVLVCVVAFSAMPFFTFIVARLITHAFEPRYALACTIGLIPLLSWTLRDLARRKVLWMAVVIFVIGGYGAFTHSRQALALRGRSDAVTFANAGIFSADPTLPIVPPGDDPFVRMEAHGPQAVRDRLVLVTDSSSVRLSRENTRFLMTQGLRKWTNLPIVELSTFLNTNRRFYLLLDPSSQGWVASGLLESHADLKLKGVYASYPVYLVEINR